RQLLRIKRLPCARTISATSSGGRVIFSAASVKVGRGPHWQVAGYRGDWEPLANVSGIDAGKSECVPGGRGRAGPGGWASRRRRQADGGRNCEADCGGTSVC